MENNRSQLSRLQPDTKQASRFLGILDSSAEAFTFQVFVDDNSSQSAKIIHGSFDQVKGELIELNRQGYGVYVTVNETDLQGRKTENITRIRAIIRDRDVPTAPNLPIEPHIVNESSPGKYHDYILVEDAPIPEVRSVQERLVQDYGSDKNAKDIARVLRVPGFYHLKDRTSPHMVRIVEVSEEPPILWEAIKSIIPPIAGTLAETVTPAEISIDTDEISDILKVLDPDTYFYPINVTNK